jgi:hypothetical protein
MVFFTVNTNKRNMAELRLAIKNKKVVKTEVTQNVGSQLKSYNVSHEKT